jgi:putative tryptophan/tyrosine transport system substrate-binding protein
MRKVFIATLILWFSIGVFAKNSVKKVLISQVIEHPALNMTAKGVVDGLEKSGYKKGKNLEVRMESAQGKPALASQIAAKFVNQKPDMVVGIGTLTTQSLAKYAKEKRVKLIFSSVTDPVGAGIVKSLNQPGNQTSGVSNYVELEPQVELFKKIQPKLKRLGILYNPGELNSVVIVKRLEVLAPKLGIILVKQTASKTAEVSQAAMRLANKTDAIFISNDNTALGALRSIVMAANKSDIPVYVSDTDAVELGALAALGPNQYQVGFQAGEMIARSFKGENVEKMPIEFPQKTELYLNVKAEKQLGIIIPNKVKAKATKLVR